MKTFLVSFFLVCLGVVQGQTDPVYSRYSFQKPEMGSLFSILIYSSDSAGARIAAEQTFELIDSLNLIYSDYLETSELNRLCRSAGTDEWVKVSEPLFGILRLAKNASARSEGSFDVTVGTVTALWRKARKDGHLPDPCRLRSAISVTGYRYILIDPRESKIKLLKRGMRLDLGGIAKGETAQRAIDFLKASGYPFSMIDAGGDIVAGAVPEGIPCWKIGINYPGANTILPKRLCISGISVTTSGDLYQYLEVNGKKYSHIIDPRNGRALTRSRNVTVIAPRGADADWLTKACSILSVKRSMKLVASYPGAELQIAVLKNHKPVFYRSPGFQRWFER
ncbi:MAG: FAD:protein FMN transferase [Chitinophagaceae bacterium]